MRPLGGTPMIEIIRANKENIGAYLKYFEPIGVYIDKREFVKNLDKENMDIFMLVENNKDTISIFGLNHLRVGVAEAWSIPGKLVEKRNKKVFCKTLMGMLNFAFDKMGLHRIEIAIPTYLGERGFKWAKFLGFQFEGICRAYNRDYQDHSIFSRIRVWQPEQ